MPRYLVQTLAVTGTLFLHFILLNSGAYTPHNDYFPDLTPARFFAIALSGGTGFAIGWFFSPGMRTVRLSILAAAGSLTVLAALSDHGSLGWSLTALASAAAFFGGLGYWAGTAFKALAKLPNTFGSSEWADLDHLLDNNMVGDDGLRLGAFGADAAAHTLTYHGDRHLLTSAPTRSGKGTSAIIPNLLTYEGSMLVIDPKGENALITAKHREAMGQRVFVVDPWLICHAAGLEPARFNPLDWLVNGDVDITENAMLLADALIVPTGEHDQFWVEEARSILQGLILFVATDKSEARNRHLGRVRDLLLLDGEDMRKLFERMLRSPHHIVASTGARCLQKEERLLANVIASAQAQTHFLDSARIRESLSASDFRFEDLKTTPTTIYLVLPSDRLNAFGRWLRLLIQQAITVNARNIEVRPAKPVLFILDEMPALGRLAMVEQAFGLMAGYGFQLWGIVQDLSQLKRIYGDGWETFISNAGVLQYFGSRDTITADYFSALCGVTTVWNFSSAVARVFGSSSGQGGGGSSSSISNTDTTAAAQRKLAYPDELMRLPKSEQLLLIENLNPIIGRKRPWFEDDDLKPLGRNLHESG
ncbi:type IV secretory system conjugative DNA transfer family protein [Afifella marina]|uniref:Type IV secretion system protein VirD4 n=1 Tax=Afifella marina DSM 2698 TaxID=1120955 RepID=A0A1G5N987_AFIMA|nr:type IV secretory system conjugative DNA transfer family protein [Afifella marina]MBK1623089.1 conjugal transfer protein TraG [Afifella marina DSM 2698]MBK1626083.1 conjugal transfer protein TraG [Afifella marina]MBK5916961.1 conjugal transfer protein TraG [Afifella marina]RAI21964.1 conjugal transfer protein TraG [Afifella marina DSM 2698]SCZ34005.1 type IV secretion system protein VirD4 [Afifella marina DSM 2698]